MLSLAIAHGLVLGGERLDREHRAERLVLDDRHATVTFVEDRREQEEAVGQGGIVGPGPATAEYGALGDPAGDVRLHLLQVGLGDQRAGLRLVVERTAEADPLRPVDDGVHELVVDRLLDDQARTGGADLAGVQEDRGERHVERRLAVRVGEDDVGVLATKLESDLLHRARGGGHDPLAGGETAGEGDQVDARVLGERRARPGPGTDDEVGHAGRQPGLLEQPHQVDGRVRRELARLEHEGVAGRQAGGDLPGHLEEWVVPGRDQAADSDRLVDDPADHVGVARVDHPAGLLGGDVAVVAEDADHVVDVVLALDQPLAGVEGLCLGDQALVAHRAGRPPGAGGLRVPGPTSCGHGPSWNARCAASIAASVSSGPASSISATSEPSAGHRISRRPPARAPRQPPST